MDTPGNAVAVACAGNVIPVADGASGLLMIDASDPPAARIVRQVFPVFPGGGEVQAVAAAADLVLVGTTGGFVSSVERDTGVVLDRIDLGGTVHDLFVQGETLYGYANGRLHALSFLTGALEPLGSAASPGAPVFRGRLFVGGGVAYLKSRA